MFQLKYVSRHYEYSHNEAICNCGMLLYKFTDKLTEEHIAHISLTVIIILMEPNVKLRKKEKNEKRILQK